MSLTMKERYARLDMSKLPDSYKSEFDEMEKTTYGFSDEDLNDIFRENFNDMYELVEKKYPDAIRTGGKVVKEKPAKEKKVKGKKEPAQPKRLPTIEYRGESYYVDFKLEQMRHLESAMPLHFKNITDESLKAKLRGIRSEHGPNAHIPSLDDGEKMTEEEKKQFKKASDKFLGKGERKKFSKKDIADIESTIWEANWDNKLHRESDKALTETLMKDFGMSKSQAEKWTAKRDNYKEDMIYGDYNDRTEKKKTDRIEKDPNNVKTRDGYTFNRKDANMKGTKFYDENGKQWTCKGYNKQLDECIMEDEDGKEIASCIKDMYVNNPKEKRAKGDMIDECKDELKKAGYSVKEHKAGKKNVKRKEPRPEKEIIKERIENTFKPIMKDISGSEEKDKKYGDTIAALNRVQTLFTKLFNRLSNLAEDNKAESIGKIEKLLKELVD